MQRVFLLRILLLVLLMGLVVAMSARFAHAATIPVNSTADGIATDGNCTLREAVLAANTDAAVDACPAGIGADTITLLSGTYALTIAGFDDANVLGDLDIASSLTLSGAGASNTLIQQTVSDRVMTVGAGTVNLSGLSITGGSVSADGGGLLINAGASVALSDVTVSNNGATNSGGGIANNGVLTISNSTFLSNTADLGGGLFSSASVWLTNTAFLSNTGLSAGGGLYGNGMVQITDGLFQNNTSASTGGGLRALVANITNTVFLSNTATQFGGGLFGFGAVTVTGGLFTNNSSAAQVGGAVAGGFNGAAVAISATVFLSNTALSGGAIYGGGNVLLDASDFAGNRSTQDGGAVYANRAIILTDTLFVGNIASNNGGAIYPGTYAKMTLSEFDSNQAVSGGALVIANGVVTVTKSIFVGNTSTTRGGAIYAIGAGRIHAINSLFARNESPVGAALYLNGSGGASMEHTTLADDIANPNTAIVLIQGNLFITNTIFANHATGLDVQGGTASETSNLYFTVGTPVLGTATSAGRIIGNPDFVAPADDDYHLGPNSQAADVGLASGVTDDIDDDPRPLGAGIDIGFDERAELPITGLSAQSSGPTPLGATTFFTASVISGTNVVYIWQFGDGVSSSASLSGTISHTYAAAGVYTVTVVATNAVSSASVALPVTVTNLAPLANAGVDQTASVNAAVTLDGSASSDPDGHVPLAFGWVQTSGPSVVLIGANTAVPTFIAPVAPATLTFALVVTDAFGLADLTSDEVSVIVSNISITGLVVQSSSPTRLGDATLLTATVATGSNVVYAWRFGDGATRSAPATTTHSYSGVGVYSVIVTATNGTGSASATTLVTVTNAAPLANAGTDQTAIVGGNVTLNGSASSDPDSHTPLAYRWAQTGGPSVTLSNATTSAPSFIAPGTPTTLTFALAVTDSRGLAATAPDLMNVVVQDVGIAGLRAQTSSPIAVGATARFTGSVSSGSNVVYAWDFGDGSAGSGASATHAYATVGVFTSTLWASNSANSTTTTTVITVTNAAPTANAGADQTVGLSTTVTLNGSASTDPDGHTLLYRWVQTGGPSVTLSNAASAQPTFASPKDPTVLSFELQVSDSYGLSDATPDSVTINVSHLAIVGLTATAGANDSRQVRLRDAMAFAAKVAGGNDVSYAWNFGDGSAVASGANASHVYAAHGSYGVIVTATNVVNSVSQSLTITVVNLEPFAIAGPDQTVNAGAKVTLDAGSSIDQDRHTPLKFVWTQKRGPSVSLSNAATAQPGFTAPSGPATLAFGVRVIDSTGLISTGQDEVVITVNAAPPISVASGVASQAPVAAQAGAPSNNTQYQPGPAALPTVRVADVGTAVAPMLPAQPPAQPAQPPAPQPTPIREMRISGLRTTQANALDGTTNFTASVQRGSNVIFDWSFGDGETGSGINVAHRYAAVGRYRVIVTATNSLGRALTTLRVNINSLPPTPTPAPTPLPIPTPEPTATPLAPAPTPNVPTDGNTPPAVEPPTTPLFASAQGGAGAVSFSAQTEQSLLLPPNQAALTVAKEHRTAEAAERVAVAQQRRQVGVFTLTFVAFTQVIKMARGAVRSRRARRWARAG